VTTVVVSDLHLGSRFFARELLVSVLDALPPEATLVLNGDTINYRLRPLGPKHGAVLQRLREESERRRVIWLGGNHDERHRPQDPRRIEFAPSFHIGRRLYVQHGFYFRNLVPYHLPFVVLFRLLHYARVWLGAEEMHVAEYAKRWRSLYGVLRRNVLMNAVEHARENGYAAVACGHTHFAEDTLVGAVRYLNTGCWTERPGHFLLADDADITLFRVREPLRGRLDDAEPVPTARSV
jgi:UDP-2,3-diacylglucosamine pyrophosphatase LpxH